MSNDNQLMVRVCLLTILRAASRQFGLELGSIVSGVRMRGLDHDKAAVHGHLLYLQDKGQVLVSRDPIDRQTVRYRITAEGMDYLDEHGY